MINKETEKSKIKKTKFMILSQLNTHCVPYTKKM